MNTKKEMWVTGCCGEPESERRPREMGICPDCEELTTYLLAETEDDLDPVNTLIGTLATV